MGSQIEEVKKMAARLEIEWNLLHRLWRMVGAECATVWNEWEAARAELEKLLEEEGKWRQK